MLKLLRKLSSLLCFLFVLLYFFYTVKIIIIEECL